MLRVIPRDIEAVGVEIDPALADEARRVSGHTVLTADVLSVMHALPPAGIVFGNPPFKLSFFDRLLNGIERWARRDVLCGFVLPAYFFQTPTHLERWRQSWGIDWVSIPRTLFPGLKLPLGFARFDRRNRHLRGFMLYASAESMRRAPDRVRNSSCTWRELVQQALNELGGCATLARLYEVLGDLSPRATWWKQKVRQTLQRHCVQVKRGTWKLA